MNTSHKLTPERVRRFLDELRFSGDAVRAALVSTPRRRGSTAPGIGGFKKLRGRDQEFAQEWQRALDEHRTLSRRLGRLAMDAVEAACQAGAA